MLSILAVAFLLGFIITIHELGHLIAAKRTDMEITEFTLGFGPNIFPSPKAKLLTRSELYH